MDFSRCGVVCSDIDIFHLTRNGHLIIGEIKNVKGEFKKGQRSLLAKLVDGHKGGGAVLYITHTQDVYYGDDVVDIGNCLVEEYYFKGEWRTPSEFITVKDALEKMERWKQW